MTVLHSGEVGRLAELSSLNNDARVLVIEEDGTIYTVDKDLVGGTQGPPGPAGPGSISFSRTIFVSSNGNDANDGNEITQPKQTIAAALTAAQALVPSATNIIGIRVEDGSVFTGNFTIPSFVGFEMPNATLTNTTGVVLTLEDFAFAEVGQIIADGASTVGIRKNVGNIGSRVVAQNIVTQNGATAIEHTGNSARLVVETSAIQGNGTLISNTSNVVGRLIVRADVINVNAANARAIHQNSANNDLFINCSIIGPLETAVAGSVGIDADAGTVLAYIAEMDTVTDLDIAAGATVNIFDALLNGDIDNAGTLNSRIIEFNGTLTNTGTINGEIGATTYGNLTLNDNVTVNGNFAFNTGSSVDEIITSITAARDTKLVTEGAVDQFVEDDTATHIVNATSPTQGTIRFTRRDNTTFDVDIGQVFQAPAITALSIVGQSTSVSSGTSLTGSKTFAYTVTNPSNVSGNLTLSQTNPGVAAQNLATNIDPASSSTIQTINDVTVNAGESVVFTLSGTDTQSAAISRTFTIRAPNPHEFLYSGRSSANNPASVDISGFNSQEITGSGQDITVTTGTTQQNDYFMIFVPTSEDLTSITDTVLQNDVTNIFTRTENVRTINSVNYTSYVVGPFDAGVDENYVVRIA